MADVWVSQMMRALIAEAADGVFEQKEDLAERIRLRVQRENRQFFRVLAAKAMDAPDAPDLGPHTPSWKPLTRKYREWKRRHGLSQNFYMKTGKLEAQLRSLRASSKLGQPRVSYQRGGYAVSSSVRQEITPGGRTRYRDIATGRFVSAAAAFIFRPSTLFIDVAPMVSDAKDLEVAMFGRRSMIENKLKNAWKQMDRPILGPFMDWWMDIHIRRIVERML